MFILLLLPDEQYQTVFGKACCFHGPYVSQYYSQVIADVGDCVGHRCLAQMSATRKVYIPEILHVRIS